ncbi:hypothetical protein C8F01DRAFT_283699 [Mycena amicta]|nr:hypothetical protein C8F01DRAFT_283699 [Mycena amicta]
MLCCTINLSILTLSLPHSLTSRPYYYIWIWEWMHFGSAPATCLAQVGQKMADWLYAYLIRASNRSTVTAHPYFFLTLDHHAHLHQQLTFPPLPMMECICPASTCPIQCSIFM